MKVTDEDFLTRITPLLNKEGVTWRKLAKAAGLSIGATQCRIDRFYREGKIRIRRPAKKFIVEAGELVRR